MLKLPAAAHGWAPAAVPRPSGTRAESFSLKESFAQNDLGAGYFLPATEVHKVTVVSLHSYELGAYDVFHFRVHVAHVGAAVDSGNHFVENILEAAACNKSKGGHLVDAAIDEVAKCCEELVEYERYLGLVVN